MKKLFAFLLVILLLLSGCEKAPEENTEYLTAKELKAALEEQQNKISELGNQVTELDSLIKKEYLIKYIKPLVLSHALEVEWETQAQLFDTEVQLVGYFVEGLSSPAEWSKIYSEGYSENELKTYIPQDIAESIIERYFGISPDRLRELSRQYNAEKKAYEYSGARDFGTDGIVIKDIRDNGENIVITCEFNISDEVSQCCELTVAVDTDFGFRYVSNRLI